MVFPFFQYPGVLPLQLFQRGISVKVIIDIGVTVEHEQTAEPAHQLTRLLIFAKRLDRTNTEIHRRYPEYTIMTLEHAKWVEWTGENDKEKKEDLP